MRSSRTGRFRGAVPPPGNDRAQAPTPGEPGRSTWCAHRWCGEAAGRRPGGSAAPGPRADVRSPVCEPPRFPRMRNVSRMARCKRLTSSSPRSWAARAGSMPARQRTSSHSRLPRPAIARLVHDHRLHRRPAPGGDGAQLRQGEVEGVGTETILVGIELDRAEPARIAHEHRATVGERHPEAVPRGYRACCWHSEADRRRLRRRPARGRSCRGAGRALRHWRRRRGSTSRDGGRRRTTGRARRRAHRPESGRASGTTRRVRRPLGSPGPGHAPRSAPAPSRPRGSRASQSMRLVMAPRSAPCASRAYLARNPLV